MVSIETVASVSSKKLTEGKLTRERSSIGAKRVGTDSSWNTTSTSEPKGKTVKWKVRTEEQCKTGRPRLPKDWEPTARVIGEIRERSGGILAEDSGKKGWPELNQKEAGRMSRANEATWSNKEADGGSGQWDQREYEKVGWEAIKAKKWLHCWLQIVGRSNGKLNCLYREKKWIMTSAKLWWLIAK